MNENYQSREMAKIVDGSGMGMQSNYNAYQQPVPQPGQPQANAFCLVDPTEVYNIGYRQGAIDFAEKVRSRLPRQRAKKGTCSVEIDENKWVNIVFNMSDGRRISNRFILNCGGPISIRAIKTPNFDMVRSYLIVVFPKGSKTVVLDQGRVSGRPYLFAQFRKAGIEFNKYLSEGLIKEGLEELVLTWHDWQFDEPVLIDVFAGWHNVGDGRVSFQSRETNSFGEAFGEKLPVSARSFCRVDPTSQGLETYIRELRAMFPGPAERMLMAAWPVVGLLSGILRRHDMPPKMLLNIIPDGHIDRKVIAGLFQIFNRDTLCIFDAGGRQKEIDSILDESRDEVLLFDCRYLSNQYQRDKRAQTADRLQRMVREDQCTTCGRNADFAVVLLSDQYRTDLFNIAWPEMNGAFLQSADRFRKSRCLEMVLTGVVNMVEKHHEDAELIFSRRRDGLDLRLAQVDTAIAFLLKLFEGAGHDLKRELAFPAVSELAALIDEGGDSDDERLAMFIREVRRRAQEWVCENIQHAKEYHEGVLYYDGDSLYFPVEMLRGLFGRRRELLEKVLRYLQRGKVLLTNGTDKQPLLVKKRQIAGIRKDYYVFPAELFNERGKAGIFDLMRRIENDQRP